MLRTIAFTTARSRLQSSASGQMNNSINNSINGPKLCLALAVLSTLSAYAESSEAFALQTDFDLPAQPLGTALKQFAEQAGLQILFEEKIVDGLQAPAIKAHQSPAQVLKMLLDHTDLEYAAKDQTIAVRKRLGASSTPAHQRTGWNPNAHLVAQNVPRNAQAAQSDTTVSTDSKLALEEIIVSARHKDEALTEVPASISAYSADFLQKQNIQSFADYATRIPNLTFQYGQGSDFAAAGFSGGRVTTIRGVAGENTTAYYINDTPIPSSVSPQTLNLERIEVLKGPQGTLYGASSMGGNLRFITRKPSLSENSYTAQLQGGYTKDGGPDYSGEMLADMALVPDKIGLMADFGFTRESGFITRTFPDASGNLVSRDGQGQNTTYSASVNLRTKVTDNFEISVDAMGQSSSMHGFPAAYVPLPAYRPDSYTVDRARDVQEYSKDRWGLGSVVLNYSGTGFGVVSSTSYFSRYVEELEDSTEGQNTSFDPDNPNCFPCADLGNPAFYNIDKVPEHRFTHETRLSFDEGTLLPNVSGVVGVFYQKRQWTVETPPTHVPELATLPDVNGVDYVVTLRKVSHERNLAAFGELYIKLVPKLTATLGARWYDIKQNVDPWVSSGIYSPAGQLRPAAVNTQTGVVPKAVLSYEVGDRGNVYASFAKGFRVGGTQRVPDFCAADLANKGLTQDDTATYQPDTLRSFEVGAKNRFADGRVTASAALFQIDWTDIQQTVLLMPCGFAFQSNAGKARIRGGEFEVSGRPFESVPLTLQTGLGYTDAVLVDQGRIEQEPNTRLTQVPEITGTLSAYYEQPISASLQWFAAADYSYTGSVKVIHNSNGSIYRQPFRMLNANTGLKFGRSQIMLYGKNLLDQRLNLGDLFPIGLDKQEKLADGNGGYTYRRVPRAAVSRPLQFGIQYRVNF